jgi:hypothetical protein
MSGQRLLTESPTDALFPPATPLQGRPHEKEDHPTPDPTWPVESIPPHDDNQTDKRKDAVIDGGISTSEPLHGPQPMASKNSRPDEKGLV